MSDPAFWGTVAIWLSFGTIGSIIGIAHCNYIVGTRTSRGDLIFGALAALGGPVNLAGATIVILVDMIPL